MALNINVLVNKMSASPPTESEIPSFSTPELQPKTDPGGFVVIESYDKRGVWSLHRLVSATGFMCIRCQKEKKARLVARLDDSWDVLCCNACYGRLLSTENNGSPNVY